MESMRQILLYAHHIFIGYDRYRRYLAGLQHASKGAVVIFDRYPMEAPLDGPQIHLAEGFKPGIITNALMSLERDIYRKFQMPDLLCILEVSPEISLQRKPDHRRSAIEAKHQLLRKLASSLQGKSRARLRRIDAGLPLEQVDLHIKRALWGALSNPDFNP
jgi:thymidylate kinase